VRRLGYDRYVLAKTLKLLAFLAAAPLLSACGNHVQKQLEGRWLGDGVENFQDEAAAAATGWARGVSFEFLGATLRVTIPAEEPRTGTYRVASVRGNDVTLAVQRKDGALDEARLKLDDEYSLRWMLGDGRAVVLHKEP
jgi:outer membrane lipopolysaccharide assembly protein LptE/RlpB